SAPSGHGTPLRQSEREAAFARRIDPAREPGLSPEQRQLMAQVERAQRYRALQRRLRSRNTLMALGIGAVVFGICILRAGAGGEREGGRAGAAAAVFLNTAPRDGYTFYSVSQERFLDELEQEAEAARKRAQARAESAAT
uniref:Cytochrome c oxidase assembly factor 3 n=1 Tax=Calidris pygmaea TaxID=425635 RepID=A0A8C3J2P0_9CHAR